jgi:hypothetical protein
MRSILESQLVRAIFVFFMVGILFLVGAVIVFGCSLRLTFIASTDRIDADQFSANRRVLPDDASDEMIAPNQVGNFMLESNRHPDPPLPTGIPQLLFAVYETKGGQSISLRASLVSDNRYRQNALSNGTNCGDCAGSLAQLYSKLNISYGYAFCGCWHYAQHTLNWTSGNWVLSATAASTFNTDGQTLLQFVNNYPF